MSIPVTNNEQWMRSHQNNAWEICCITHSAYKTYICTTKCTASRKELPPFFYSFTSVNFVAVYIKIQEFLTVRANEMLP
jgi:hypothetical protein